MSARAVGRAAAARLWQFKKVVVIFMAVIVAVGAYGQLRSGPGWGWALAIVTVLMMVAVYVLLARVPNGREVTALYLELAKLTDQYSDGQLLRHRSEGESRRGVTVFRCYRQRFFRGFVRIDFKKAEPPQIDQKGWMPVEQFVLIPFSNLVFQFTKGAEFDEEFIDIAPGPDLSRRESDKAMLFMFRTGRGFAAADELGDLVRKVREAHPFEGAA